MVKQKKKVTKKRKVAKKPVKKQKKTLKKKIVKKKKVNSALILSADWCPYCQKAKMLLLKNKIPFVNVDIEKNNIGSKDIQLLTNQMSIPQIYLNGKHIGGYTDLAKKLKVKTN